MFILKSLMLKRAAYHIAQPYQKIEKKKKNNNNNNKKQHTFEQLSYYVRIFIFKPQLAHVLHLGRCFLVFRKRRMDDEEDDGDHDEDDEMGMPVKATTTIGRFFFCYYESGGDLAYGE